MRIGLKTSINIISSISNGEENFNSTNITHKRNLQVVCMYKIMKHLLNYWRIVPAHSYVASSALVRSLEWQCSMIMTTSDVADLTPKIQSTPTRIALLPPRNQCCREAVTGNVTCGTRDSSRLKHDQQFDIWHLPLSILMCINVFWLPAIYNFRICRTQVGTQCLMPLAASYPGMNEREIIESIRNTDLRQTCG